MMTDAPPLASSERQFAVHTVRRFFELMHDKDIDAWGELWHDQGRIVIPYPADGFPTSIAGKSEIVAGFKTLFANFETFDYELVNVCSAADADVVVVEWKVRATLRGGVEYTNDNITLFELRDGLIVDYHDYFDPRRFQTVVDALAKPAGT